MKRLLLICCILCLPSLAWSATYNVLSCSRGDVNAAINNTAPDTVGSPQHTAVDGDIINLPACAETEWATPIVAPSNIGIQIIGAGIDTTTIRHGAGTEILLKLKPTYGNSMTRVSGITFVPKSTGAIKAALGIFGTCTASGCPTFRIDHVKLPSSWNVLSQSLPGASPILVDNVYGVADNNTVGGSVPEGNGVVLLNVNFSGWKGTGQFGDNSWYSANTFGTDEAVYLEDNTFDYAFGTDTDASESYEQVGGGRIVCRNNTFTNMKPVSACGGHGTETTGRPRGIRQGEFYRNSVATPAGVAYDVVGLGMRSGVGISFENTYTPAAGRAVWSMTHNTQRISRAVSGWGYCSGAAPWDANEGQASVWNGTVSSYSGGKITVSGTPWSANAYNFSTSSPGAYYYVVFNATKGMYSGIASNTTNELTLSWSLGSAFYGGTTYAAGESIYILRSTLYGAGTHTGSSGVTTLTDSSKSWTNDEWIGYNVINVSTVGTFQIGDNDGTTLTSYQSPANWGTAWTWTNGDAYAILKVNRCLDQGSSYGGSLMSGQVPAAAPTAQTLTPSYQFGENLTGYTAVSSDSILVTSNKDYYMTTGASCTAGGTCTSGTGSGTTLPASCTNGTAFWKTDEGSWNQSGSGGQGVLYQCQSGSWVSYYTPYTYPHPLRGAGTPATATHRGVSVGGGVWR